MEKVGREPPVRLMPWRGEHPSRTGGSLGVEQLRSSGGWSNSPSPSYAHFPASAETSKFGRTPPGAGGSIVPGGALWSQSLSSFDDLQLRRVFAIVGMSNLGGRTFAYLFCTISVNVLDGELWHARYFYLVTITCTPRLNQPNITIIAFLYNFVNKVLLESKPARKVVRIIAHIGQVERDNMFPDGTN